MQPNHRLLSILVDGNPLEIFLLELIQDRWFDVADAEVFREPNHRSSLRSRGPRHSNHDFHVFDILRINSDVLKPCGLNHLRGHQLPFR